MEDKNARNLLVKILSEEHSHVSFDNAVENIPLDKLDIKPEKLPYSIWRLAEHIRITQWDIVEFCLNSKHKSPKWPDEYWPHKKFSGDIKDWNHTIELVKNDRKRIVDLIKNPEVDLLKPLAHGSGQTLLREILLILDHTSYHTGQIILIRRLLGIWD